MDVHKIIFGCALCYDELLQSMWQPCQITRLVQKVIIDKQEYNQRNPVFQDKAEH